MPRLLIIAALLIIIIIGILSFQNLQKLPIAAQNTQDTESADMLNEVQQQKDNPLAIVSIKTKEYPGSEIKIDETLPQGANYNRYIASYMSDGLKIYGLLTVPLEASANNKKPAIVFGHGYIPPEEYRTTEKYVAYVDSLASAGYVVFKIDYRGHGSSEGDPSGAYFSPGYTTDTINASQSIKKLPYVEKDKVGVWGHSMAGMVITRILAARPDEFQSAVIWAGVVGSYEDILREWWSKRQTTTFTPSQREMHVNRPSRKLFIEKYGEPKDGDEFWDSISPVAYIDDIKTPIQLDHGEADETVPVALSTLFAKRLEDSKKTVVLNTYPGTDHNLSQSFNLAMQRTIDFFDKYLK